MKKKIQMIAKSLDKTDKVICSYCTLEKIPNLKTRSIYAWKNNLTLFDFISIFLKNSFIVEKMDEVNNNTTFNFKRL